jgi:hypothetical protein
MAKWILRPGTRMVWRDENNVRHEARGGDEVDLTEEQEQRHRAGQPGSAFLSPDHKDEDEPELVEVAVANEATKPSEDGTVPVSGARNRKVVAAPLPKAPEDETREEREGDDTPEPVTTTRRTSPTSNRK